MGNKSYIKITITWLITLTILSFIDFSDKEISTPENSDKIIHFLLYFILTFLCIKSVQMISLKKYLIISISCFIYGTIIEVFQELFTQTRKADALDVLANTLGILVAVVVSKYFIKNNYSSKFRNLKNIHIFVT